MMKRILLFVALALAVLPARAAIRSVLQVAVGPSCTAYTGPGDVNSGAVVAYGLRAYTCALAASNQNLINIRRTSDSRTCDVKAASTGGLGLTAGCSTPADNGTAVATWCNATTCFVVTLYELSGSGAPTATQATTTKQPQLLLSGCGWAGGTAPCMQFVSANVQCLASAATFVGQAQPYTFLGVSQRTTDTTNEPVFATNGSVSFHYNTSTQGSMSSPTFVSGLNGFGNTAWHSSAAVFNSPNSAWYVASALQNSGLTTGTNAMGNTIGVGGTSGCTGTLNGFIAEVLAYPSALGATPITNINLNQRNYWNNGVSM